MIKQLRLAAVPLIAGAMIAFTTASAWAFSQQTLSPNGNYDFNYSAPNDKPKLGDSANKPDSNNSGFHFSIERGQTGPFGFRGFGNDNDTTAPPDYYTPHGNGN